jgi:PEGA domain
MKIIKLSFLILVLLTVIASCQTKAEADGRTTINSGSGSGYHGGGGYHGGYHGGSGYHGGYHGGYGGYHGGYGYRGYGYRGYGYGYGYRPFFGFGFGYYSPYYWGGYYAPYNPYYAYPAYGYGYGYNDYGLGGVRTEVKPKEAGVYVDGGYVGTVDSFDGWWQRLQLPPGDHRLVFRAVGYAPYVVDITVIPGQDVKIKQQMQPGQDAISDKDMQLDRPNNNGNRGYGNPYQGKQPNNPYGNMPNGQEENSPNNENPYGYGDRNAPPPPDQGQNDLSMEQKQDSNRLTLALTVHPIDATIYIDENYYGTSDANQNGQVLVLLPAGTHKIEVVRPGYESYSKEIQVDPQSRNNLDIQLQKK